MKTIEKVGFGAGILGVALALFGSYKAVKHKDVIIKELAEIKQNLVPLTQETEETIEEINEMIQDSNGNIENWRYTQEPQSGISPSGGSGKKYYIGHLYQDRAEYLPDNVALPEILDTPIGQFKWSPRVRTPSNWGWIKLSDQIAKPVGGLIDNSQFVEIGYVCDQGNVIYYHNKDELIQNVPTVEGTLEDEDDDYKVSGSPPIDEVDTTGLDYDDKYSDYYPMPFKYGAWMEMEEPPQYYDIESGYDD